MQIKEKDDALMWGGHGGRVAGSQVSYVSGVTE